MGVADPTVVIPVFNQAGLTRPCLDAVLRFDPCRVVVVDDGSTDATPALLRGYGKRITVITHRTNRGFARAANAGAAMARGRYLVFLNNDTLPHRGWLRALVRHADQHPKAAAVGSKLLYPDGTVQHAGVVIGLDHEPRHLYAGFPGDHPAVNHPRRLQAVTAACMLVRRTAFAAANGFDECYRNGLEDVDLCLLLGVLDQEVHYCPKSVVTHFESMSEGRFRHMKRNIERFRSRWKDLVHPDDFACYREDGLLQADYEGRYPFRLTVSPLLAIARETKAVGLSRRLGELSRENARLRAELAGADSGLLAYRALVRSVVRTAARHTPVGARLLVASKGDDALLRMRGRRAGHFPQTAHGVYAGHHPADGKSAVQQLERLGANFFVLPQPQFWWLDHYPALARHLGRPLAADADCRLYALKGGAR